MAGEKGPREQLRAEVLQGTVPLREGACGQAKSAGFETYDQKGLVVRAVRRWTVPLTER